MTREKLVHKLYAEYQKSYNETPPGKNYPEWLTETQLSWVLEVVSNLKELLPNPDCNFYDGEAKKWIWAYSEEMINSLCDGSSLDG